MKKNSFTLFSTLVIIFIFSILIIKIFEVKTISSQNIINQYTYIQAKNHLAFLEEYILSLKTFKTLEKIEIELGNFDIYSNIEKKDINYEVHLFVKSLNSNVSLYKKLLIPRTNDL